MKFNKAIVAGINLSFLDENVLSFTKIMKSAMGPANVIFFHAIEPDPEDVDGVGEDAVKVKVQERVGKTLAEALSENDSFAFEVGDAQKLLLKESKKEGIDLMILGKKVSERNHILTKDLINSASCSVFLIPEHAQTQIRTIVVGVDFSEQSHASLGAVVHIANHTGAEIHCVNIYHVPSGYHTSGKSYDEYAKIMKGNAIKASEEFKKKYHYEDVSLNFQFLLNEESDAADLLYRYAKSVNADLISLGSKGLDGIAGLFFETTAEKIVELSNHIPTLIIKRKGKNHSFLDAIREM